MIETQAQNSDMLSIHRIETTILFPENTSSDDFRKQKQIFLAEVKKLPAESQKLVSNILKQKALNIDISNWAYNIIKSDKTILWTYKIWEDINNLVKNLKDFLFKVELWDTQNELANLMWNISTRMDSYATSWLDINSFQKDSTLFNAFFNRIRLLKNSGLWTEWLFNSQSDTTKFFDDLDKEIWANKVDRNILPLALTKEEILKNDSIDNSIKRAVVDRLAQTWKDKSILFRCTAPAWVVWIFLTLDS